MGQHRPHVWRLSGAPQSLTTGPPQQLLGAVGAHGQADGRAKDYACTKQAARNAYGVTAVVMRPMATYWVNHIAPSGPVVIP
jgi:hypothetical protein